VVADVALRRRRLAERPRIEVPSVILHGADDGVDFPARSERDPAMFPAGTERHVVPGAGHFLPREQPRAVADALLSLLARTR
jgi:pimeloyl-ACP methyl ester carboxylesterase